MEQLGNALQFNGSSNYVDCGNGTSLDITGAITIEAWVKKSLSVTADDIVGHGANGYLFYITGDNILKFGKQNVNGIGTKIIADVNWHHVSVSYNGSNASFYIDGQFQESPIYSSTFTNTTNLFIGADSYGGGTEYFNGLIDEVRVYGATLTSAQIQSQYYAGLDRLLVKGLMGEEEYKQRLNSN
jgi:hypothetical protein